VNFNATFFTRLLSACENEGAMFRSDACPDFKEFDDQFKKCIDLFRLKYQQALGKNNHMPARNDLKCKGITQIKHYIANQMIQNFDELYDRNMKKHYKLEETSDSDSESDSEEWDDGKYKVDREGLIFLCYKLNEILENNATLDAKKQRLIHLSPFFKCCAHYIHLDSKVIIETIRQNLGAKTHADLFSHRVHQYNKREYKKMRKKIELVVPTNAQSALLQTLGFPVDFLDAKDLFNNTAGNTKKQINHETHGLTLNPKFNKFSFAIQTNAVGCTLCWNWQFQYPVLNPDYVADAVVPELKKKRKYQQKTQKTPDIFDAFDPNSPQANAPYWKHDKASVSANFRDYKPEDYDDVIFIDPGKVFFLYGAKFCKPPDDQLRQLLKDPDSSDIQFVKQHVKYWLRTGNDKIPFKTHLFAINWLKQISRNVGKFHEFMNNVFPKLYDTSKYLPVWHGEHAFAFKKIYRRGRMERNSKRQHKHELVWKHEITNHKKDAKVLIVVGNAYLNWKNTSTKQGSAPGKSIYKFLKNKKADIVEVDEYYTSQTCARCDTYFGKKKPKHRHNLRDCDTKEQIMFFNDETQKVEIECKDKRCRLQICRNQDCPRLLDTHNNKSFARDGRRHMLMYHEVLSVLVF
jgi:hypothetical protein